MSRNARRGRQRHLTDGSDDTYDFLKRNSQFDHRILNLAFKFHSDFHRLIKGHIRNDLNKMKYIIYIDFDCTFYTLYIYLKLIVRVTLIELN